MGKERFGHKSFEHRYQTNQLSGVEGIEVLYSAGWYYFSITEDGNLTGKTGGKRTPKNAIGSNKWREIS